MPTYVMSTPHLREDIEQQQAWIQMQSISDEINQAAGGIQFTQDPATGTHVLNSNALGTVTTEDVATVNNGTGT